jgi:hypothetical protein
MNRPRPQLRHVAISLVGLGCALSVWLSPAGARLPVPSPDRANNPPLNTTCSRSGCHDPQGGTGNGSVAISWFQGAVENPGIPNCYVPGQQYRFKIKVTDADATRLRWGFEVGVQYSEGNQWDNYSAGTLANAPGARTAIVTSTDNQRKFVGHDRGSANGDGTYAGQAGSAEWEFLWTAPGVNDRQTQVCFYIAGVAADNDDGRAGDRTYNDKKCMGPCGATDVNESSWGRLKTTYR